MEEKNNILLKGKHYFTRINFPTPQGLDLFIAEVKEIMKYPCKKIKENYKKLKEFKENLMGKSYVTLPRKN